MAIDPTACAVAWAIARRRAGGASESGGHQARAAAGPKQALDRSEDQRGNDEESGDGDDHPADECVSHVPGLSDPTESFGVNAAVGYIQLEECVFHGVHHRVGSTDEVLPSL